MRRLLLLALTVLALSGCGPEPLTRQVSQTPKLAGQRLDADVAAIADRARPGVLGVGLMNLESGEVWTFNGDRRFPMQSVAKAILGAVVLGEVDAGRLSLDDSVTLAENDISPPFSPIAEAWPARTTYTIGELLVAAVGGSDNTAADMLMRRVGGPGAVTAWLAQHHIDGVRVDRYERELQPEIGGLESFRIGWKGDAFARQLAAAPVPQRAAMLRAYLKDPRDTATPRGMLAFLRQLQAGELLSPASTKRLLRIMTETKSGPGRIKAGLPDGARLAHKTGTARTDLGVNPAVNDVGIITLPDGRSYALAVYLSGATLNAAGREAVIADVTRAVVRAVG
jgi:beta-lactamase class A